MTIYLGKISIKLAKSILFDIIDLCFDTKKIYNPKMFLTLF